LQPGLQNHCQDHKEQIEIVPIEDIISGAVQFLKGKEILDVVRTAQECLNNIISKTLKALVLKLDLHKAYNCVNWDFL
jgi:hypothetical protein